MRSARPLLSRRVGTPHERSYSCAPFLCVRPCRYTGELDPELLAIPAGVVQFYWNLWKNTSATGGPDGPMVQNISADGSQIALILDLGAHHLDLMFSDPRNPPCFTKARAIEERMIKQWIQEAYDAL